MMIFLFSYGPYKGPGNPIHDFPFEWLGSGLVDAAVVSQIVILAAGRFSPLRWPLVTLLITSA